MIFKAIGVTLVSYLTYRGVMVVWHEYQDLVRAARRNQVNNPT